MFLFGHLFRISLTGVPIYSRVRLGGVGKSIIGEGGGLFASEICYALQAAPLPLPPPPSPGGDRWWSRWAAGQLPRARRRLKMPKGEGRHTHAHPPHPPKNQPPEYEIKISPWRVKISRKDASIIDTPAHSPPGRRVTLPRAPDKHLHPPARTPTGM